MTDRQNGPDEISNDYVSTEIDEFVKQIFGSSNMTEISSFLDDNMAGLIEYLYSIQQKGGNSPKKHHLNPVFALSNFSIGSRRENYRIVQHINKKRSVRKTENVAAIMDFNTANHILKDDPYVIERYYSKIEDDVSKTIKKFKIESKKNLQSQINTLTLFLGMQITRSLRQRNLLYSMAKNDFERLAKEIDDSYKFSSDQLEYIDSLMEDMALLYSLRHIVLHTFDLRNRSVIFISSKNSKVINAPDPAIFLNDKSEISEQAIVNSHLLYPLTRDLLVMFPRRASIEEIKECYHIQDGDEQIDLYNRILLNQSPDNEIFMHPDDEKLIINSFRNFDIKYDPQPRLK